MNILLNVSDIVATIIAFFAAYLVRNVGPLKNLLDSVQQPLTVYLMALPLAVILLLVILRLRGLYHPRHRATASQEMYLVVQSVSLWAIFIMAGSYLAKYDFSRIIVMLFWTTTIMFVSIGRWIIGRSTARRTPESWLHQRILIVGVGRPAKMIARQLHQYRRHGYHLVGFIGVGNGNSEIIGTLAELPELLHRHRVQQVYFADPSLPYREILNLVNECPKLDTEFRISANIFPRFMPVVFPHDPEAIPSLDLKKLRPALWYRAAKRTMDVVGGMVGILVTAPLALAVIVLIKMDSRGPAILRQTRVGKDQRPFTLYKFRTMRTDAELFAHAPATLDDPRITQIGRYLRKTSLDELPQLWNVVLGHMSLVGPRPEMPFIVQRYEDWQKKRFAVKPGITGLWQILGRKDLPLNENLEYDFYYVNNQSLLLDCIILLRTIPLIIFGRGAY